MRQLPILVAATLACVAFSAHAATFTGNPCSLLKWEDFKALGAKKNTMLSEAGWHKESSPADLPESELFTNLCAITIISKAGRTGATLSFTSFRGKITEQQVRDWLKTVAEKETMDPDVKVEKLNDTACEAGKYNLPTSQRDGSVADVVERYVACDKQVELQHLALNINVPEKKKGKPFTVEQTSALLDRAIERMKSMPTTPVPMSAPAPEKKF